MKNKLKSNSGFTLIELIIAIAILAFLMTAVGSMMSSSVLTNRKAQADITVQDAAQLTYNKISDAIMQSKKVFIEGYMLNSGSTTPEFSENGKSVSYSATKVYLAKKMDPHGTKAQNCSKVISELSNHGITGASEANIKFFDEITSSDTIYVSKRIVYTSEPITGVSLPVTKTDYEGQSVTVSELPTTGDPDQADTVVNTFTFIDNKLYLEKKYLFSTGKNDVISDWTDAAALEKNLYSNAIGYVTNGTLNLSGCLVRVDAKNGSIGVDLNFNDKKMTYTTLGMVNIRNSYVLRAKN